MGGLPFQNQPQNVVRTDEAQIPAVPLVNRAVDEVGRIPFPRTSQMFIDFKSYESLTGPGFPIANGAVTEATAEQFGDTWNPFLWNGVVYDRGNTPVGSNIGVAYPLRSKNNDIYYDRFQVVAPADRPLPIMLSFVMTLRISDPLGIDDPQNLLTARSNWIPVIGMYSCVGGPAKGRAGTWVIASMPVADQNDRGPLDNAVGYASGSTMVVVEQNCVYEFALLGGTYFSTNTTIRPFGLVFRPGTTATDDLAGNLGLENAFLKQFSYRTGNGNSVGFEEQPVSSFTITTY